MSRRRFYDTCDHCGERSAEYTPMPTCSDCDQSTCGLCSVPGSLAEFEYDSSGDGFAVLVQTVTCQNCQRDADADRERDEAENVLDAEAEDAQEYLDRRAGL